MKYKKRIRIRERKMAEYGLAHNNGDHYVIDIHPNHRTMKSRLNTTVHEAVHVGKWDLSEENTKAIAWAVTHVLWRQGWRRIETK